MAKKIQSLSIRDSVREALATSTLRQSGITFVGTVINGALGAVFYILAARSLGPSSFGILTVALQVFMFAGGMADLGIDTALVRFVSYYKERDLERAKRFLKLSLEVKLISGIVVVVLGVLASDIIATFAFQKPELSPVLKIAFVGVLFMLLFNFILGTLKAFQRFVTWSLVQIGQNSGRLLLTFGLFSAGIITVESSLWVYGIMLLVAFIFGIIFLIPKDFLKIKNEFSVASELIGYSKWVAIFSLIAAFSSRLDIFISARFLTPTELGFYGAANQLVFIVPQIIGALGTVIAPKMSGMDEDKIISYIKKTQILVLALAFLGLLSTPVVAFLVPIIYGSEYVASIPIFVVLLLSMLVFLVAVPVHNAIIYYFSYPKFFFYLSLGHLFIMFSLGSVLILRFGMIGAATAVLVGSIFNFVIPALWVYGRLRK